MPPDSGAFSVFRYKNVLQIGWSNPRERSTSFPYRKKKRGDIIGFLKLTFVEVISPAVRDGAALTGEPLELELFERERSDHEKEVQLLLA
jgi:hypothetical protein